jgi:hypothetical protein
MMLARLVQVVLTHWSEKPLAKMTEHAVYNHFGLTLCFSKQSIL